MTIRCGTFAAAVLFMLVCSSLASADIAEPGAPQYTNSMFSDFVTPTVRPGDDFTFSFRLENTYDDQDAVMTNISLTMGIYMYATQEETDVVDDTFSYPPLIDGESTEKQVQVDPLNEDQGVQVSFLIETGKKTPHGSYFDQATYFVRLQLAFQFEGNDTTVLLQSRGYFTDDQWDTMVSFDENESLVNTTYMHSLGVDGLIPDSSFGIKVPIPVWPLGILVAGCALSAFGVLYYFALDNPGKYPKLEKRFYQLRGELGKLGDKLKNR